MKNLKDLFVHQLKDIFDAENQLLMVLDKTLDKTKSSRLHRQFKKDLKQTKIQIDLLEKMGEELGEDIRGETCKGMKGLIKELKKVMKDGEDEDTRDAAMIAAYQKIKHYEIATYGTLTSFANMLKFAHLERELDQNLRREKRMDRSLTSIAEKEVNREARV